MLTDILEVVEVAHGPKPAHLSAPAEGWRIDAFEHVAREAGLRTIRTPMMRPPQSRNDCLAREFPLIAAAMRARKAAVPAQQALWVYRDAATEASIARLVAGEHALLPAVLGYPECCVDDDARSERGFVRALVGLYEKQHGIRGEADVLRAMEEGLPVRGDPGASSALEPVWRTRIAFPYLGYTACRRCLARHASSPSAGLNRAARLLAMSLDREFASALWRAALAEAALATTGDFRSLDPAPADPCPCGSGALYGDCCIGRGTALSAFR